MAKQNAKGFLFPAFRLNGDDGASHVVLPCKDAWGFNCSTLSRCSSFLISNDLFTRPRCAMHDQVNLVFTESSGAQFVYGLLGLRLDFKNAYHGGTVIICYCHEFFLSQVGCRATPGNSTYLFHSLPPIIAYLPTNEERHIPLRSSRSPKSEAR